MPVFQLDYNTGESSPSQKLRYATDIYILFFLKIDLSKYFFFNGGLSGDFDVTKGKYITSQSGLALALEWVRKFHLHTRLLIQLNPYLNFHGLLLAKGETYPERIFDAGVKLNLILRK